MTEKRECDYCGRVGTRGFEPYPRAGGLAPSAPGITGFRCVSGRACLRRMGPGRRMGHRYGHTEAAGRRLR